MTQILSIDAIVTRRDRFHCTVLRADLCAGTCLSRQNSMRAPVSGKGHRLDADYPHCRDCSDGRAVATRLGERTTAIESLAAESRRYIDRALRVVDALGGIDEAELYAKALKET